MRLKVFFAAAILAISAAGAQAVTVVNLGPLVNTSYNAGNVNIGAGSFQFNSIISGLGGFSANTYVNPFRPTGFSTAVINLFVKGSRFKSVTGSWGGNALVFSTVYDPLTKTTNYAAAANVAFAQAGLAGAQLFKLNWRGGNDIKFQVTLAAVPVPAAASLLAGAIGGLGVLARRRKARAAA